MVRQETILPLTSEDPAQAVSALRTLAKEKGATYLVWGEYQRLGLQLNVFGQIVSVTDEAAQRFSVVREGVTTAIATAARDSAGKISQYVKKQEEPS